MIVIDSSLWIEFFIGSKYGEKVLEILNSENIIYIPTIVITEVYKKFLRDASSELANNILEFLKSYITVNLDIDISTKAANFGNTFKLSLADSIIYATTLHLNAKLYTLDKHFKELPEVYYFEKQ